MKRIISVFILIGMLILPLLFPLTASAEVTTLTTSVPNQVTLSVEITGKGTVSVNGQSTSDKAEFLVDRLENMNVYIAADSDYLLKTIYLDGADVTDTLNNGLLTIENIQFDADLAVTFVRKDSGQSGGIPVTGDTSRFNVLLLCWFGVLTMLVIPLRSNRKNEQ